MIQSQRSCWFDMASIYELLGILFGSFLINLIPFAGPSNLLIASTAALSVQSSPLVIGFLVALGSSAAKSLHYLVTFFVGSRLSEERRQSIDAKTSGIRRWAFLLLFTAAATPIPDEPVIIPLGLMKYSPLKFFSAFFSGKVLITILGAFLGNWSEGALSSSISPEALIVISVVLTIVISILLLRVDLGGLAEWVLKRLPYAKRRFPQS